jgi:hypothetical protein
MRASKFFIGSWNKLLYSYCLINKQCLPVYINKNPLFFHCSILNKLTKFSCRKSPFTSWNSATVHKAWIRNCEISLLFPFTALTAIHCHRYTLNVTSMTDLFISVKTCCHVTSNNAICHCHIFIVVTSKLTTDRVTVLRLVI